MSSEADCGVAPSSGVHRPAFSAHPGRAAFGMRAGGVALLALSVMTGCGESGSDQLGTDAPHWECEREGYPCTWGEVPRELHDRGLALAEVAERLLAGGGSPEDAAELLAGLPGMAEAALYQDRIRFRLDGARPVWITSEDELEHHRGQLLEGPVRSREVGIGASAPADLPPVGSGFAARGAAAERPSATGRGAPAEPDERRKAREAASLAHRVLESLADLAVPERLHAASPLQTDSKQGVAAEEVGTPKKALIVAPFEWEFPGVGGEWSSAVRRIRDYGSKAEGEVDLYADLEEWEENRDRVDPFIYGEQGEILLRGGVHPSHFMNWDDYNLVLLASHGTGWPCSWRVDDMTGEERTSDGLVRLLATRPGDDRICPQIWAGRARYDVYAGYPGLDLVPVLRPFEVPFPGLTPEEAEACAQLIASGEETPILGSEDDGVPCTTRDLRETVRIALTFEFFEDAYPEGLSNTVVFLAACRSGINHYLPDQLIGDPPRPGASGSGQNENVAVFAFDVNVDAGDAFNLVTEFIQLDSLGYHTAEILKRLRTLDRTKHLVGRTLAPGDEHPPGPPPEILERERTRTHARDVVLLVDPTTGEELEDGDSVLVRGAAGDGEPDRLRIRPQVIGVAGPGEREQIHLHVGVVGGTDDGEVYPPETRVGNGAYRWNRDVELGRDHADGEVVDLEVRADLPGGGRSRWVYEDILLLSRGCSVTVTVSGEYSGRWTWTSATLNPLRPGPGGKQWGYTNSLSRNGYFMINNESGHFEVVHSGPVRPGGGGAGIRSVWLYPPHPEGWSARSRSPTEGTFQLTEYTEDRMAGTFSGTVIAVPPTPDGRWYGEIPTASVEVAFDLDPRPGRCASPVPRSPR